MYTAGKIYWAYLSEQKTQVLILETCGKYRANYKVVKIHQTANGSVHEYELDLTNYYTIDSNAFISYISNLSSDMFTYVFREYSNTRVKKIEKKKLAAKSALALEKKNQRSKTAETGKIHTGSNYNFNYRKKGGGYANPKWLPPGTTRIKVYRG